MGVHTAEYTYNVEGYSLPSGAEDKLFEGHFEVMVSESYDWWTFAFTVPYSTETFKRLSAFDRIFGPDDTGIRVETLNGGGKIKTTIYCRLDTSGPWVDTRGEVFEPFVPRLLDLRDEVMRGDLSGLELIAARFDPANWQEPGKASDAATWLARSIEAGVGRDGDDDLDE